MTERDAGTERKVPAGIVIRGGETKQEAKPPRISAFIWGGRVNPEPTLPFGRWKPPVA